MIVEGLFAVIIVARGAALHSDNIVTTNVCDVLFCVVYVFKWWRSLKIITQRKRQYINIYCSD